MYSYGFWQSIMACKYIAQNQPDTGMSFTRKQPSISKSAPHFLQVQLLQNLLQTVLGILSRRILEAGDDQLVFHRMLPADQLGHRHLVAVRFQLQAAQHIGDVAAEFAGVDAGGARSRSEAFCENQSFLFLRSTAATSAWQQGTSTMNLACFCKRETDRVVGGRIAGMQRGHDVDLFRQLGGGRWTLPPTGSERTCARKPSRCGQLAGFVDQLLAGFDAVDVRLPSSVLEEQVVQDEAQIGFSRAVVGQAIRFSFSASTSSSSGSMNW